MKPCELQPMIVRAVEKIGINDYWQLPPEARVITGNPRYDAQLHYMLVEFGVEVELDRYGMKDYRVVDEQKFMMFLLRWA